MEEKTGIHEASTAVMSPQQAPPRKRPVAYSPFNLFHLVERIGLASTWILICSVFIIIIGVAFLAFLWYGTVANKTWHLIIVHDWATRAIALTSVAIRAAIGVQTGIGFAMLASLALERYEVPLEKAAEFSLLRVGGGGSFITTIKDFCWPLIRGDGRPKSALRTTLPIAIALLTTSTFLQFGSTILLSDVHLGNVPGFGDKPSFLYDFNWNSTTTPSGFNHGYLYNSIPFPSFTWGGPRPQTWPAFAEYHEAPFEHPDVSDTGMSLRSFLPYASVEERQSVRNYTGKAFIMDSRVTCQKPKITDVEVFALNPSDWENSDKLVNGKVQATVQTPRLKQSRKPVDFTIPVSQFPDSPWAFAITELAINTDDSGYLVSEFRDFPQKKNPQTKYRDITGAAYLIASVENKAAIKYNNGDSRGFEHDEAVRLQELNSPGLSGPEWTTFKANFDGIDHEATVWVTICYAALDVADRSINAYSDSNRTEPSLPLNTTNWYADPTVTRLNGIPNSIRDQLVPGYPKPLSAENRGILNIGPGTTWNAPIDNTFGYDGPISNMGTGDWPRRGFTQPYVSQALHLFQITSSYTYDDWGNYSAVLDPAWSRPLKNKDSRYGGAVGAQAWLTVLFQDLAKTHNTAVALQAVLTALAGGAYYSQLPDYDKAADVSTNAYVVVNTPGGPFGTKRTAFPTGFVIVIIGLLAHLIVLTIVVGLFAFATRLSRIGDPWQAVADLQHGPTGNIVQVSSSANSRRATALSRMEEEDTHRRRVGLSLSEDGEKVHFQHRM